MEHEDSERPVVLNASRAMLAFAVIVFFLVMVSSSNKQSPTIVTQQVVVVPETYIIINDWRSVDFSSGQWHQGSVV